MPLGDEWMPVGEWMAVGERMAGVSARPRE